jgi:hypothetical protein
MLKTFYPTHFLRYSSLAIFGPIVDGFSSYLVEQRYTHTSIKQKIGLLAYIEAVLIRRGIRQVRTFLNPIWSPAGKACCDVFLIKQARRVRWKDICTSKIS